MDIEIKINRDKEVIFSTLRELLPAYEAAMKLVDSRQEDYGDSWVREGLGSAIGSAFRKASGIQFMFEDGVYKRKKKKYEEDLLDLMNYAAISWTLLQVEDREDKELSKVNKEIKEKNIQ
jgi:sulfur relay (sulfurtransferase) DsrF/TusC family protein